jgi:hypothetical protein
MAKGNFTNIAVTYSQAYGQACKQTGRQAGRLAGWQAGRLVGWQTGSLADRQARRHAVSLAGSLAGRGTHTAKHRDI